MCVNYTCFEQLSDQSFVTEAKIKIFCTYSVLLFLISSQAVKTSDHILLDCFPPHSLSLLHLVSLSPPSPQLPLHSSFLFRPQSLCLPLSVSLPPLSDIMTMADWVLKPIIYLFSLPSLCIELFGLANLQKLSFIPYFYYFFMQSSHKSNTFYCLFPLQRSHTHTHYMHAHTEKNTTCFRNQSFFKNVLL